MAWWVALQHVEAARQSRLGGTENREIMQVLDLVVHVELRQQKLQPRNEVKREFSGRQHTVAELRLDRLDHGGEFAEHGVAR